MRDFLSRADWELFRALHSNSPVDVVKRVALFFSDNTIWWAVAGITIVFIFVRRKRTWFLAFMVVIFALGVSDSTSSYFLKPFFARERPCIADTTVVAFPSCASQYGFPSNHAANSMAVSAVLVTLIAAKSWRLFILFLAGITGLSRVILGVHLPLDVIAGFFWGGLVGTFVVELFIWATQSWPSSWRLQRRCL